MATCQGFLKKKGQKRWFILHNNVLYWFKNEQKSATFLHSEIKGCLELKGCTIKAEGKDTFTIENEADKVKYSLIAPSRDIMERWMAALNSCIEVLGQDSQASEVKRGELQVGTADHLVVLKDDSIMWFAISGTDKKAKGSFSLVGAKAMLGNRPNSIQVAGRTGRPITFVAKDNKEANDWQAAISQVASALDVEIELAEAEKSGYLQKKGQTRWFTIQKGKLLWYKKMQTSSQTAQVSAKNYLVLSQSNVTALPSTPGCYPIRLVMSSEGKPKTYELIAPSDNECKDWIDALCHAGAVNTDPAARAQTISNIQPPTRVEVPKKPIGGVATPGLYTPSPPSTPTSVSPAPDSLLDQADTPIDDSVNSNGKKKPPVPPRRKSLPNGGSGSDIARSGPSSATGAGAATSFSPSGGEKKTTAPERRATSVNPRSRMTSVYSNTSNEKSGWLGKKGKRRWFVLQKGILSWYTQPKNQGGTSNGSLNVTECDVSSLGELQGGYAFTITQRGGTEYILLASSLTEMEDWMLTLVRAGCKADLTADSAGSSNQSAQDYSQRQSVYRHVVCTKSGWMEKKGRKRWFLLRNGELSWYKSAPPNEEATKRDMAGKLETKKYRVQQLDSKIKGKFALILSTGDEEGGEYILLHPKEAEITEWVEMLLKEGAQKAQGSTDLASLMAPGPAKAAGKLFGAKLEDVLARENRLEMGVPILVERCVNYIKEKGLKAEGIFRLSGDSLDVNCLKSDLEKAAASGGEVPDSEFNIDVHAISSLLKLYFREMEPPIMTYELYDSFMEAAQKDVAAVKATLELLPQPNQKLLKYLMEFLYEISTHQEVNKMAPANIAICFSPNMFRSKGSPLAMLTNSAHTGTLTQMMIAYPTYFWPPMSTASASSEGEVLGVDEVTQEPQLEQVTGETDDSTEHFEGEAYHGEGNEEGEQYADNTGGEGDGSGEGEGSEEHGSSAELQYDTTEETGQEEITE